MNALSLAVSTAGIIFASTFPALAQAIRTPFGALHMEMSIVEAESALGAKSYLTDYGSIIIESKFNGYKYHVSFNCLDRILRCDKKTMKPTSMDVVYTNEISADIRPREATKILEEFGLANAKANHEKNCSSWNTKTVSISAGILCSSWGIRMKNREFYLSSDAFGLGGFTQCTESCF